MHNAILIFDATGLRGLRGGILSVCYPTLLSTLPMFRSSELGVV